MPLAHPTKTKGDLAVAHAYTDLMEQGHLVCWPATEHAPFDLVAYRDDRFLRVQVKYRTPNARGVMSVELGSVWSDGKGLHRRPMDKTEVDIVCVYCPTTGECYYVRAEDCRETLVLRLGPCANNQVKGVHFADQLRTVPTDVDASQLQFSLGDSGGRPLC